MASLMSVMLIQSPFKVDLKENRLMKVDHGVDPHFNSPLLHRMSLMPASSARCGTVGAMNDLMPPLHHFIQIRKGAIHSLWVKTGNPHQHGNLRAVVGV